jgi:hypothetical protein
MRNSIELPNLSDARPPTEFASLAEQSGRDGIFLEDYIIHHSASRSNDVEQDRAYIRSAAEVGDQMDGMGRAC